MNKVQILSFLVNFLIIFKNLLVYAIIARVIVSWFQMGRMQMGRITSFLYSVTDPVINLAKKIPHQVGMIDFSALIALLAIDFLGQIVINALVNLI